MFTVTKAIDVNTATTLPPIYQAKPLVEWTKHDVQTWLSKCGLANQRTKFEQCDGKQLKELQMKYHQSLCEKFNIHDQPDLLKFAHYLNELK